MNPDLVVGLLSSALQVALTVAAPMLIFGLTVGLTVSIFQAVTQIQEMTLAFVPKIFAIMMALAVFFPWMGQMIITFTSNLLQNINTYIGK